MTPKLRYLRFSLARRVEHWVMVTSFTVLAITGLPQKYANSAISDWILGLFGGIESTRIIHRIAAILLMFVSIYHFGTLLYNWLVLRGPLTMMPTKQDLVNAWQSIKYNLGKFAKKPKQGFYTFEEKLEYWALIWGTLIMIISGFFLWNPITSAKFLPAVWIPVAKSAHGNEALLAVLAIIIWHFYHVLIKHFNTSIFTGFLSARLMKADHELVLEEPPVILPSQGDPAFQYRRQRFKLIYGLITIVLIGGLYWFVTTEQTASAVPAEIQEIAEIESFSPIEPSPSPTAQPLGQAADIGNTWENGIAAFLEDRCGVCHREGGGIAHLDMVTYPGVLSGGDSGPAIVPDYPGVSLAIVWQTKGEHPGGLNPEEITALKVWVLNGAPEK
jgi:formate dehydrogenase gamma subunit